MTSDRVTEAFASVDRAQFLPASQRHRSNFDGPISIGIGSTCSQPSTVRAMLELLDVQPGMTVLDVGSGSGWTAGLLAHLVGPEGRVVGVELIADLVAIARQRLAPSPQARIEQASTEVLGWPADAPYHRILVSADATPPLPQALVDQLRPGGIMVIPVAGVMTRAEKALDGSLETSEHGRYRFVPLRDATPPSR